MTKVLFIEDSIRWQEILRKLLETAGYESQRANSFEAALGCLSEKDKYDVIVLDLLLGEKFEGESIFVWLDALIQGLITRKLQIPPIIIMTGVDVSKRDVIQVFTEYRGYVYAFFEKHDFDPKDFLKSIREAKNFSPSNNNQPRPFIYLFVYALLMVLIAITIFGILLWSVNQITDPKTQQTILQVGGAVIVVIGIFIAVFSQNSKVENVIESLTKIIKG
jgi:CheY-like chemotaxis protein